MGRYLDMINSPADVKLLTLDQLQTLAQEIRDELITVLSKTGGHLGPNLGVVELTIALHRVFESPKDRFVWDVSHQVYVHKLLTGRRENFHKIRQSGGPMGFAYRAESPYDCFGAGHAGTALSAALGMAAARDHARTDEHVVCIAGDAALTNGITYEALNNIKTSTKRLIVILNDNEWSIAKNVGAISEYLNRIVRHPSYAAAHKRMEHFLGRFPRVGPELAQIGHKVEEAVKGMIVPSLLFEEFGLRYIGPMDGHNTGLLIDTLQWAKKQDVPVLLHILTKKGKGYEKALEDPQTFHGCGPFDIATGKSPAKKEGTPPNYQDVFADALVRFCDVNSKLVGITAAMPSGTSLGKLQKAKPVSLFRCRYRRGARGHFRRRNGDHGIPACLRDLLDVSPARLRLHHPRRRVTEPGRDLCHGSCRSLGQRRPHAPRRVRYCLRAMRSPRDPDGAQGRG